MSIASARHDMWSDLRIRALSAAVLVPPVLLALIVGGWLWLALVLIAFVILVFEWYGLASRVAAPNRTTFLGCGIIYAGVPAVALVWLRECHDRGAANVLFVITVVWASDIGAYLIGRLVGGAKLAPAISPAKTVSGALGGLGFGVLAGLAVARGVAPVTALEAIATTLIAGVISISATMGDLAESAIKRRLDIKDSGRLIPGHGGAFDRLDGLLVAAPVAAAIAWVGTIMSCDVKVPLWY